MKTFAFFDLDNTLIKPVSLVSFFSFMAARDLLSHEQLAQFEHLKTQKASGVSREQLNLQYYAIYKGMALSDLMHTGELWFQGQNSSDFFYRKTYNLVEAHRAKGHKSCIVSGSFLPCIAPIQRTLAIDHVICTKLDVANGRLTGRVTEQAIGQDKQVRMAEFIQRNPTTLVRCYAYADDISDLAMLSMVGHPVAIASSAYSRRRLPPNPRQSCHPFQSKAATPDRVVQYISNAG